jgi:hypothetical protein
MKRVVLVAAASVLALTACSKKADTAANGATSATTASAPEASKPAAAMSAPTRKAGLWEQSMNLGKMTQTMKMCIDEATEQKMKWYATESRAGADNPCTEQSVKPKLGGGWTFHSVCKMGESGTIVSDGDATGDFGSHYTVKVTSVTTGSSMPQANGTHEMTMEGTWKGACPAGMKGGDIQLANGMTFNPTDTAHMGGMTGHGPGGRMTPDDIARLRAQSRDMAKAAHEAQ